MSSNVAGRLTKLIAQTDKKKLNLSEHVFVFILSTLIVVLLPGPTYYAGFLLLFVLLSFLYHQDLSTAFFHAYLFVFFFERPFFYLNSAAVQEYFYYQGPKMLFLTNSIPIRFIVFIFLAFSVFINQKFKSKSLLIIGKRFLQAVAANLLILFLLSINQIFGAYKAPYSWQFIHLFQIFLTFPVISIFFLQRSRNSRFLESIRPLIASFIIASLVIQGVISVAQFGAQSRLNLRIEHIMPTVYTPEENIFRSAGTFSFPNYLGVNTSMLLLFPILFSLSILMKKRIKQPLKEVKQYLLWGLTSTITGFFALFLNFSRWVWITFILTLTTALFIQRKLLARGLKKISRRQKNILVGGISVMLVVLLVALIWRLRSVRTINARIESTKQTISLIERHPFFGVGPGLSGLRVASVGKDYDKYTSSLKGAHNTILYIAADNGLILALIFVIFIDAVLFHFFKFIGIVRKDLFVFSLALAIFLFLLNSLAYPLYIFDTSLELFLLFTSMFFVFSNKSARPYHKKQKQFINLN